MTYLRCPVNVHNIDISGMELEKPVRVIYQTDEVDRPYRDLSRASLEIDDERLMANFLLPSGVDLGSAGDVEVTADVFYIGYPNYPDGSLNKVLIRTIVVRKLRRAA